MTAASTIVSNQQSTHSAFQWVRSEPISSLNIEMQEYKHRKTGAVHYHLASDNPENVFLVGFRTVPMDSTGVAHILEHTALCGSRKYPVRDPFFMMIRRSLNTFIMNAFTSSDWTAYPFASKNRKDFNNLLSVYMDAVFFSRLHELDFAQEGHRLEFEKPDDQLSDLVYKGVVYNEMKGAMSSTNSVLWQTVSKYIFPTSTYHYNSGGEPDHIPDLSYQQLKDFYKSHYHPSNAVFMTFGDISAQEHHEHFEELALKEFEKLDIHIAVTDEKRYLSPIKVEEYYESDENTDNKSHVVLGWLLGTSTSLDDLFEAQLLSSVLMDNSASPLLQVLETSSLGSSPSPMCGLEDSNREMSFLAGLEGCANSATNQVEKLILDTLENIVKTGVPQEQIEAALHQLELNQREISGDSYPYGLQLILAGLSTATHRGDPIQLLNIDPVLERLRQDITDRDFIPRLINKLLLNNQHRICLTMHPDSELPARKVAAEKSSLRRIKDTLSEAQKQAIIEQSEKLNARQNAEDDPGVLPKVGLEDVPATITEPEASTGQTKNQQAISFYGQGTNGLSYQQLVIDLPQMGDSLLQLLPLFTSCITELGVGENDYAKMQVKQSQLTGGINCFSSIRSKLDDEQKSLGLVSFSAKALRENNSAMSQLLSDSYSLCRFDEKQRVKELVEQLCARKENSITGQGHSLAMGLASSRMSPTSLLSHNTGGLEGIRRLKTLRDALANDSALDELLGQFQQLHQLLLQAPRQFLIIGEQQHEQSLISDINDCWPAHTPASSFSPLVLDTVREPVREAWTTATQVNFCAKAYPTVTSSHEDNAALQVLSGFMRNAFLHRAIREQGGAYGGGASQDGSSACFKFFSYRDPRLKETLDDFDRSIDWMLSSNHPDYLLEEAILGVIAAMDKPSSPAGEAKQAFYNKLFGRSLEFRNRYRQQVLNVTLNDLKRVTECYLTKENASIGVITNKDALESADIGPITAVNL